MEPDVMCPENVGLQFPSWQQNLGPTALAHRTAIACKICIFFLSGVNNLNIEGDEAYPSQFLFVVQP